MRKVFYLILILILAATVFPPSPAPARADDCVGNGAVSVPFAKETIAVSTSAIGLTEATYNPTDGPKATEALIGVQAANIRVWFDGTAPTTTAGQVFVAGQSFVVCALTLRKFLAIRDDAADAELAVTYSSTQ